MLTGTVDLSSLPISSVSELDGEFEVAFVSGCGDLTRFPRPED